MLVLILGFSGRQYTQGAPISGIRFQAAGGFPGRSGAILLGSLFLLYMEFFLYAVIKVRSVRSS